MLMSELITKKRDGGKLTAEEIRFIIKGYTDGSIPDYQMSAFLMAVFYQSMDAEETLYLTMEMMNSGDTLDLSGVSGITADKHSTGGVGDKTSLVLVPMVASLGVKMAKMSGRGLGHTGGTLDKLESIPGFSIDVPHQQFLRQLDEVGMVIAGQTADLVPADKKMYALRDVTATVNSIPLIVSSIMSKKLAAGAGTIVLDVKVGKGSFMKTEDDARELAQRMVDVGTLAGRNTVAVITDMDQPLGNTVGNALEVKEAIMTLRGEHEGELLELCLELGACVLTASGKAATHEEAKAMLRGTIADGSALKKFAEFVKAQKGDSNVVNDLSLFAEAPVQLEVTAEESGYVAEMDALEIGRISLRMGGGRATKEDDIDPAVGVVLTKKVGDAVQAGEAFAVIHGATEEAATLAAQQLRDCIRMSAEPVATKPLICSDSMMRLDKLLRERGIATRTETKELIAAGRVTVNGIVADCHSMLCEESDVIAVDGPVWKQLTLYI